MSVFDEWMQWALGVFKDMNVECVWRKLGECMCIIMPNKCLSRYPCNLLCMTVYDIYIGIFQIIP